MRSFAPLLLLLALPAAAGTVYRWVDAKGTVHFSQTPPPSGQFTSRPQREMQPGVSIVAPPPPAPPAAAAAKAVAPAETAEAKARRCKAAQERKNFLASTIPNRVFVQAADGSEARMTEEQYAAAVQQAELAAKGC
jgi:type IV secretory pathway TrbL component